jgi:ABC-type nitrate/sulfonate/bicarbonate transport system ATPase subunit
MIRFQNVTKSFEELDVLKDITFEIKTNEIVTVLGPSGSGKTTLLRLIAGTLKPDRGIIEVQSHRIGYIFQDYRLLPWRTARDNISLVLQSTGMTVKKAREKACWWMDRMELKGFYKYYPAQMSGGMLQRVSIARAFAIEPEIMLMDEPFSSLDAELADSLLHQLQGVLKEYRTTVVFVTHDIVEALSVSDRLFRLSPEGFQETPVTDRVAMLQKHYTERLKKITDIDSSTKPVI